jgi:hypothetical protein
MSMSREKVLNSHTFDLLKKGHASFLRDFSSVFDFSPAGKRIKCSRTEEEADFKAIESDWKAVGDDIKGSFERVHV